MALRCSCRRPGHRRASLLCFFSPVSLCLVCPENRPKRRILLSAGWVLLASWVQSVEAEPTWALSILLGFCPCTPPAALLMGMSGPRWQVACECLTAQEQRGRRAARAAGADQGWRRRGPWPPWLGGFVEQGGPRAAGRDPWRLCGRCPEPSSTPSRRLLPAPRVCSVTATCVGV